MDINWTSLAWAVGGGIIPAMLWLWFWLREDSRSPEPRRLIALAFLAGMCTVAFVIPLEEYVQLFISDQTQLFSAWSAIEETCKFLAALAVVLWNKENDEPLDAVIYMITIALGFSAAENALFLYSPLGGSTFIQTFVTGDLRFVGATLLHLLSSATIGVALAISFYGSKVDKVYHAITGLILAIVLHATFNFFILNTPQDQLLRTFIFVWVGVVALLAVLEYVKRIKPKRRRRIS